VLVLTKNIIKFGYKLCSKSREYFGKSLHKSIGNDDGRGDGDDEDDDDDDDNNNNNNKSNRATQPTT
jgi:hypothetical protein